METQASSSESGSDSASASDRGDLGDARRGPLTPDGAAFLESLRARRRQDGLRGTHTFSLDETPDERDARIKRQVAGLKQFEEMAAQMSEEEGRIMDEIVQRIDRDWDMSAVPFSFYLHETPDVRAERIASERAALAATLEGDPAEHRATWEALNVALAERQWSHDDERASG